MSKHWSCCFTEENKGKSSSHLLLLSLPLSTLNVLRHGCRDTHHFTNPGSENANFMQPSLGLLESPRRHHRASMPKDGKGGKSAWKSLPAILPQSLEPQWLSHLTHGKWWHDLKTHNSIMTVVKVTEHAGERCGSQWKTFQIVESNDAISNAVNCRHKEQV